MIENRTIAQEINAAAARKNVPLSVQVEITYRCNLACFYCYQQAYPAAADLPFSFWAAVFEQLARAGTLYLTITGGEPFARADAIDIVESARRQDLAVSIISNGTLITETIAGRLAELGVVDVGVSLLAASAALHDRLCGRPGSFVAALGAIRHLKTAGIKVLIKHTVSTENFGEYRELDRLSDSEGCLFEADSLVVPQHSGRPSVFALSEDQHVRFMRDMGIKAAPADSCSAIYMLHCDAGRSLCGITADGSVTPCIQLPLAFGNLTTMVFDEIWSGKAAEKFRHAEKCISSVCDQCSLAGSCSRCHGIALLENGIWDGPSPSLCTRARAMKQIGALSGSH
jgi:AdoMet-dependent heme synthase